MYLLRLGIFAACIINKKLKMMLFTPKTWRVRMKLQLHENLFALTSVEISKWHEEF